ncbi:MAG: mandelate racemase/muconate lactonizing enzyme family protein [Armatimonadota bacterium]|nr:mandelate racemase/muconate lactonizing enzyme family protein [Armatimonadota bacterium]MDR5703438.1 mandelate racemase/muconate lactonizing enzyme family protein [Armatimonadota bacterium]
MSGGRSVRELPSTVVRVLTDTGVEGWGEVCPLGSTYLPAFAEGARSALRLLAPALIGADPRNLSEVHERMESALKGHAYAKSPLDIACWDILGKVTSEPVVTLLGGRRQDRFPLYMAVPMGSPEEMRAYVQSRKAEGIRRFQLKIGGNPREDAERVRKVIEGTDEGDLVIADANGGWRLQDAIGAVRRMEGYPRLFLEQPCPTLEECRAIRRMTTLPMIYDELVTDIPSLLVAIQEGGASGINLKISRVGGLTKARQIRDLAEALGVSLTIEDMWGGDITTAAVSHLAASTRPDLLFTVSFMNDWVQEHIAGYEPRSVGGFGRVPMGPGLGIQVDLKSLGKPLLSIPTNVF